MVAAVLGWWVCLPGVAQARPAPLDSLRRVAQHARGPAQAAALLALGRHYQAIDPARACGYTRQALRAARGTGAAADTLRADALTQLGYIHRTAYKDSLASAEAAVQQALAIYTRYGLANKRAKCYSHLGFIALAQDCLPDVAKYMRASFEVYRQANNLNRSAVLASNLGNLYTRQGDYLSAKHYELLALKLAERLADKEPLILILNNIANRCNDGGEYQAALPYSRRALALVTRQLPLDTVVASVVYECVAASYLGLQQPDSAYKHAMRGLRLQLALGRKLDSARVGCVYASLADIEVLRRRDAQALRHLQRAEKILLRHQRHNATVGGYSAIETLVGVWATFADVYIRQGKLAAALHYATQGLSAARQHVVSPFTQALAYKTMADAQAALGVHAVAYRLRLRADSIQDSLLTRARSRQMLEMQARYDLAQREARIGRLRQAAAAQRVQASLQTNVRNLLLLGLASTALLSVLWYRRYRLQRRQARALALAHARLGQLLSDKEVLLKEVHHRVKNNLQIISSLLALQTRSRPEAKEAVQEGQGWLRAIALVHEMLYQSDDLASIDMQTFLNQLTSLLGASHGASIRHTIDAAGVQLNTSTAVPLGLIVNELLTNAHKHAFPDGQPGTVAVRLAPAPAGAAPNYQLTVTDDGVGLPADVAPGKATSLGLRLITSLVRQLGGEVQVERLNPGTQYRISFNLLHDSYAVS